MTVTTRRQGLVALGLLSLALVVLPRPAEAQLAPRFELRARADTAAFRFFASQAPLTPDGELLFLTPGSAQASASSFSGSTGFAGAPYAGPLITTLPGTANGLAAGSLPPFPDTVPGYVSSSFPSNPNPPAQELGTYRVKSASSPDGTFAEARFGAASEEPAALASIATAEVNVSDKGSVAGAVARTSPLSVSDLIRIGDVRSVARVEVAPDGSITKTSRLDIGTFTIAGTKVGLTEDGFVLGDQDGILPELDLSAIDPVLEEAGISFEIVPGSETETSITSSSLRVTYSTDVPVLGATETSMLLGQVTAAADVQQPPELPEPLPTTPATAVPPPTSSTSTAPSSVTNGGPPTSSAVSSPPPQQASPSPSVPAPSVAGPANGGAQPVAQPRAVAINYGPDALDFYLVLVLGALGILVAGRVTAAVSVRLGTGAPEMSSG